MNYSTNPDTRTYPRNPHRGLQEEIWELKDVIVEKNDKIKELEGKLTDKERQLNELDAVLDAVLVQTLALLHAVNGCLRKRDKTIDELESKLHG